jgi:hypothetical protein
MVVGRRLPMRHLSHGVDAQHRGETTCSQPTRKCLLRLQSGGRVVVKRNAVPQVAVRASAQQSRNAKSQRKEDSIPVLKDLWQATFCGEVGRIPRNGFKGHTIAF